ncbi:hypothetical protein N8Z92_04555 [Schleiferiaceae bacterium]|nr:hypothetical protein [Schleiferiaceae bacterium]
MDKIVGFLIALFSLQVVLPISGMNIQVSLILLPVIILLSVKTKLDKIILVLLGLLLSVWVFAISVFNGIYDYNFYATLFYTLSSIWIYSMNRNKGRSIIYYSEWFFAINGFIMVYEVLTQTKLIYGEETDVFIGFYRSSGLSVLSGAYLSVCYSVLAFYNRSSIIKMFLYVSIGLLAGRTGILIFFFLLLLSVDIKRFLQISFVFLFALFISWSYLSRKNPVIYHALEFAIKYKEAGRLNTSSSDSWLESLERINLDMNYLSGSGNFGMRSAASKTERLPYDIGLVRILYGGGVLCLLIWFLMIRQIGKSYFRVLLLFNLKELALCLPVSILFMLDD